MSVTYKDYYKILGVEKTAGEKEIKTAYRKLARKWHPDLHAGPDKKDAEEKFKEITEAYEVLSDQEKRSKYDHLGANWQEGQDFRPPSGAGGFHYYTSQGQDMEGFSDFFETLFGGRGDIFGAGRTHQRGPMRGEDLETDLEITLEEAYHGVERSFQITGSVTNKTLSVKIPAGVHEGSKIRLKGQGAEGFNGGTPGDLYLRVRILPHPLYKVNGDDLEIEVAIRPEEAVLGSIVQVPTLDGPVNMKVPAGTHAANKLRLKGKGMPHKGGRGDEYVKIKIDIPNYLTAEEEKLYRQLAELKKGV